MRRAVGDDEIGDGAERRGRARLGDDGQHAELFNRVAQFPRIADIDREALQALDRLADILAADGERDDLLNVRECEAEACCADSIDAHLDIASTLDTLGIRGPRAGDLPDGRFDLTTDFLDDFQVGTRNLDADRALDAG